MNTRISDSVLIERLLAALTSTGADHSTVKLCRNAKGDTQIEVSVRTDDKACTSVYDAALQAQEIYNDLRDKYPPATGPMTGEQIQDAIFALPIAGKAKKEIMGLLSLALPDDGSANGKPAKGKVRS